MLGKRNCIARTVFFNGYEEYGGILFFLLCVREHPEYDENQCDNNKYSKNGIECAGYKMKCTGKQFYYEKEKQKKNDSSNDKKDGRIVFFHGYLLRNSRTETGKKGKEVVRELCFDDELFFGARMQKF